MSFTYALCICPSHMSSKTPTPKPVQYTHSYAASLFLESPPKDAVFIVFNRQPDSNQSGLFILREVIPLLLRKVMCLPEISANEVKKF